MPQHPGSSHNPSGGTGFNQASAPLQGLLSVPQGGIIPGGAPSADALSEIVQMLRGGQVGAERFLEVLELLTAQTLPQMDQGQPQGPQAGQSIPELLG